MSYFNQEDIKKFLSDDEIVFIIKHQNEKFYFLCIMIISVITTTFFFIGMWIEESLQYGNSITMTLSSMMADDIDGKDISLKYLIWLFFYFFTYSLLVISVLDSDNDEALINHHLNIKHLDPSFLNKINLSSSSSPQPPKNSNKNISINILNNNDYNNTLNKLQDFKILNKNDNKSLSKETRQIIIEICIFIYILTAFLRFFGMFLLFCLDINHYPQSHTIFVYVAIISIYIGSLFLFIKRLTKRSDPFITPYHIILYIFNAIIIILSIIAGILFTTSNNSNAGIYEFSIGVIISIEPYFQLFDYRDSYICSFNLLKKIQFIRDLKNDKYKIFNTDNRNSSLSSISTSSSSSSTTSSFLSSVFNLDNLNFNNIGNGNFNNTKPSKKIFKETGKDIIFKLKL